MWLFSTLASRNSNNNPTRGSFITLQCHAGVIDVICSAVVKLRVLSSMKTNRRDAALGLASAVLLSKTVSAHDHSTAVANEVFAHGVASGDPGPDSVVLWTRVSGLDHDGAVQWQVATDSTFKQVVASGSTVATAARDYTVKVLPGELAAGQTYFYRFECNGVMSPVGRTHTLPEGGLKSLVVAVASCSNFPFGRFNGYQAIADDQDVNVVVHLGDYIYEYSENGYGGDEGRRIGRIHEPRHETVTLADYRARHAQYKADSGSAAMHAMHPLIPTWDDHESTNNPWSGGAQNHQDEEGAWLDRRSVSLRAYYEWMPVREPGIGGAPESRRAHFAYGDLASLFTVETRHMARAKQVEFSEHREALEDKASAQAFYETVVGDPARRMISEDDAQFLEQALRDSVEAGQPWRIFLNQTILAKVISPNLDDGEFIEATAEVDERTRELVDGLTALGSLELPANMDAWDGYPAARERLYALARKAGVRDLLAVTGDTHVFWQNHLADENGHAMGLELGTSGITSPRGFSQLGETATRRFDALTARDNASVDWVDGSYRGFIKLTLTPSRATADFVALSNIETRGFKTTVVRSVDIVREDDRIDYA